MDEHVIDVRRREVATLPVGDLPLAVTSVQRIERGPRYRLARAAQGSAVALVVAGRCRFGVDGAAVELAPGGVYAVLAGQAFTMRDLGRGHTVLRCTLGGPAADEWLAAELGGGAWQSAAARGFGELLRRIRDEVHAAEPHAPAVCAGLLCAAVALLRRAIDQGPGIDPARASFERCRAIIDREHARLTSVREAAAAAAVSPVHLARLFRRFAGIAPLTYLEQRRMAQAQALLAIGDRGVAEIAAELGYASPFTFSRAFKRVVGVAPSRWGR